MLHPTTAAICPRCARGPSSRDALGAIIQTLRAMALDQALIGWRWPSVIQSPSFVNLRYIQERLGGLATIFPRLLDRSREELKPVLHNP
jgi:hypothetical protein